MGTELTTTTKPDDEQIRAEVRPILDAAKALAVTDEQTYGEAMVLGAECAKRAARVEDLFKPSKDAAHRAWKTITGTVASLVDPLNEAKKLCTTKASRWRQVEQARRQAEQRAAEDVARKAAEETRLRAAVTLEQSGAPALAAQVLEAPVVAAPVEKAAPIRSEVKEVYRENWQVEVVNFGALVQAVKDGKVPFEVLQPNLQVLRVMAKAAKGKMEIPGVRMWDAGSIGFRRT
jgi:hypothetical protein